MLFRSVTGVEHEQEMGVIVRDLRAAMAAAGDPAHVEQRRRCLKSARVRAWARDADLWVRAFVENHPGPSPLSRREALKHL